jgi:DNA-binding NtrC family response regulator
LTNITAYSISFINKVYLSIELKIVKTSSVGSKKELERKNHMTYSILVVDDDGAVKESVEEYLKILKYNVRSAANAQEALDTLQDFHADVVITDIMMQGMDGLELTKKIKAKYDADVMVMTGYSAEYSYEEAVKAGASDFIFKPFKFEELDLRLTRVLRESEIKKERV